MLPAVPGVHRIRSSLKLGAVVSLAAALGLACAPAGSPPAFPPKSVSLLQTQIVATGNDAGRMTSAALAKDGVPTVSYLLLTPTLAPGQLAPAVVPNTPQPPAVMVATYSSQQGFWSRASASGQDYSKAKGTDTSIANKDGKYLPGVNTGVAVDAQGKTHVIWATPTGLFYTDDTASAAYADPEQVTKDAVSGGSVAVDDAGTPWIAYYDAGAVTLATKTNGAWVTQVVAQTTSCASCPPVRTAVQVAGTTPIVAYTDGSQAIVQSVSGKALIRSTIGQGGFGISLVIGTDGVGYVAYYTQDGSVNVAGSSGPAASASSWSAKPVSTTQGATTTVDPAAWSTGIGADSNGNVYATWVDPVANQVRIAHGTPAAALSVATVPQSLGGQNPSLAVAADGSSLVLPFYDSANHQLAVAVPVTGGVALGVPSPSASPPPTAPSGPPCSPTSTSTQLQITAPTGAAATGFVPTCLAVVPKVAFTVAFDNQDATAPHNWELFKDPAYTTRVGGASGPSDIVQGPTTQDYPVDALAAGIYYFRCDVHPTTMIGELVVAEVGPQPGPSASPS